MMVVRENPSTFGGGRGEGKGDDGEGGEGDNGWPHKGGGRMPDDATQYR